jgi:8-oxo-dGTP pyrophosphatase MutT (NUDIX family)/phosphohistidine phosphatase SixA
MSILSATRGGVGLRSNGKPILAGGAVITREDPVRGTEVVLVHRREYNDWSLPKGKLDNGESMPACAVREVAEETGVTIRLGVPLDVICYPTNRGMKQVFYWGGVPLRIVDRPPDNEVDMVSWLPIRVALNRLTYAYDHDLLKQHTEQPPTTPLVLLRHVKAMDRKDWSRRDATRPINSRGRRQARLLSPMLDAYGIRRLVTSTANRCQATFLPYAQSAKLSMDAFSQLTEEVGADDPKGVAKLIGKIRQQTVSTGVPTAICLHRPVLPHILNALDMVPTTLTTGEFLVAHLTNDGEVHALERHRPQA